MKKLTLLIYFAPIFANAQECGHLWNKNLEINPVEPKRFVGDTYAGYGLMAFKDRKGVKLVLRGGFPKARFMSIETYTTKKKRRYDVVYDYQIDADVGSENPFLGATHENSARAFTVELIHGVGMSGVNNRVHLSPTARIHAFYYRIYAPETEFIAESELPKVFAVDEKTQEEVSCPQIADAEFSPDLPQILTAWVPHQKNFHFLKTKVSNGQNSAIPSYLFSVNRMTGGDVAVIHLKAPLFQADAQVRFWSFCTQNIVKGQTLNCVPDYLAKVDKNGVATLVVGKGKDIEHSAQERGFFFLEDRRGGDQKVMQFVYRNLMPAEDFSPYEGEFHPEGVSCSREEFLAGCQ